jgi:hypothetical protein
VWDVVELVERLRAQVRTLAAPPLLSAPLPTPPHPSPPPARPSAPRPHPLAHPSPLPPPPPPRPLCLRAQHVFPLSMLRLHEHEWHQMVDDVWVGLSKQHGEGVAMDADN